MSKSEVVMIRLTWKPIISMEDYSEPSDWAFESEYRGLRVSCGCNDGGPVAWVGHPTEERWYSSVACDGSFESGAARAVRLADEVLARPDQMAALGIEPRAAK